MLQIEGNSYQYYQNAWQNNYALIKWVTFSDLFLSHLCFHIFHGISSIDGTGGYQHYSEYIIQSSMNISTIFTFRHYYNVMTVLKNVLQAASKGFIILHVQTMTIKTSLYSNIIKAR